MKRIYFLTIVLLGMGLYLQAQEEDGFKDDEFKTIFGGHSVGGYGGIGIGYTSIDSRHAVIFDARGGVVLGHKLAVGFAGAGFVNEYKYDIALSEDASLAGGYGGLFVEPILFPNMPVHLSFPLLAGVGGAAYSTFVRDENGDYYTDENNIVETSAAFLIIEPAVELEFNFTRWCRAAIYFSYRYTSDLDMIGVGVPDDALNSFNTGIRFKFGKF